jgi:hypothetical protein
VCIVGRIHVAKKYRSGSERDSGAGNFISKDFGKETTHKVGTGVEKVDNKTGEHGVCKVVRMTLARVLVCSL